MESHYLNKPSKPSKKLLPSNYMMSPHFISIGIPFYNAEKYLSYAIQSVINQSYGNWELILIDDGSSDNSLDIAIHYEKLDKRIRTISDGLNRKLPYRLNQLTRESQYDFIARMDADDIMHPERLITQLTFLIDNPHFELVSTGLVSINNNNVVKGYRSVKSLDDDFSSYRHTYPILHPSVLGYRKWFERNPYSESFPRAEDYELWCRAISKNDLKLAVIPDLLLYYREEGNLDKQKILNSYNDVRKIRSMYCHDKLPDYIFDSIKTFSKSMLVYLLDSTNNLQLLAKRRNNKFSSNQLKQEYQSLLSSIIDE